MFMLPRMFDRFLIRRLNALPINQLLDWAQHFVDELETDARVFYFDSAVPRAFAAGKSIFISVGMLELLSGDELKAVLAHESWHIMHNHKTHWLKQLSLMTFTRTNAMQPEIEQMADNFASNIVGPQALISARSKIFL
ncbi:MAG: M48 family metalloprotease [ANME-2 cluster archaeon]|nr:M48 family metalloprotease [ANME-2 cluster archaeon]